MGLLQVRSLIRSDGVRNGTANRYEPMRSGKATNGHICLLKRFRSEPQEKQARGILLADEEQRETPLN